MSNFSPKIEDSTEKELYFSINEHDPRFSVISSNELTKRSLDNLEKTIKNLIKKRVSKLIKCYFSHILQLSLL